MVLEAYIKVAIVPCANLDCTVGRESLVGKNSKNLGQGKPADCNKVLATLQSLLSRTRKPLKLINTHDERSAPTSETP